ncbi:MAG TPA: hypothetical protein VMS12_01340, partial [Thermoanaerobaculia bacterium]|nr:hypothetical protein [Thermoanaerobaculia bacterium]
MQKIGYPFVLCLALSGLVWGNTTLAQSGVKVEMEEVVDDRFSDGPLRGSLQLRMALSGKDLERAEAARVIVREARDDRGTDLLADREIPDFESTEYGEKLNVRLHNPARQATSFQLNGAIELFVPSRDPNSRVRVEKALARLDTPINAKGLRAAKISVTPLSREKYKERTTGEKLDEAKIAEIRERGKAEGASDEEITEAIEFIKALQELGGGELSEGAVVLAASTDTFDRIQRIDILGADGKPMSISSRSTSSWGNDAVMTLEPSEPLPKN